MATPRLVFLILLSEICCFQLIAAGVLFRFAYDFQLQSGVSSTEENVSSIEENVSSTEKNVSSTEENGLASTENMFEMAIRDNNNNNIGDDLVFAATVAPMYAGIWTTQHNLTEVADNTLQSSTTALQRLHTELAELGKCHRFMAAKVQLITCYLNKVSSANAAHAKKFKFLEDFVNLVDALLPSATAEDSLEYALMHWALAKHNVLELQQGMQQEVLPAHRAWQQYVKTKLVEVAV